MSGSGGEPDPAEFSDRASPQTSTRPGTQPGPPYFTAAPPGLQPGIALPGTSPMLLMQQQVWQSPYPPPEAVERFEKVLPGTFDRILTMVEKSQDANIRATDDALSTARGDTRRGQWLGFVANIASVAAALVAILLHQPWVAATFIAGPALAVAKALVDSVRARPFAPPSAPANPPIAMPQTGSIPISPGASTPPAGPPAR